MHANRCLCSHSDIEVLSELTVGKNLCLQGIYFIAYQLDVLGKDRID